MIDENHPTFQLLLAMAQELKILRAILDDPRTECPLIINGRLLELEARVARARTHVAALRAGVYP